MWLFTVGYPTSDVTKLKYIRGDKARVINWFCKGFELDVKPKL